MTNRSVHIQKNLAIFSILLFFIVLFSNKTINVSAATQADVVNNLKDIDDGIKDWTYKIDVQNQANKVGNIPIGDNISLGYTFGSARDVNNRVVSGGDTTVTHDSVTGTGIQSNSKINIFLNKDGAYYGILNQGANSYIGTGATPGNASNTSLDFAYLTADKTVDFPSSILNNLQSKVFFYGTDANKRDVFKIGGYLSNQNMYAQILLRPSLSGAPIVQRELYLKNTSTSVKTKLQVYYGEDTAITASPQPTIDDVPLYSLGNNQGLYMYSSTNTADPNGAKMYVTNNVADGFDAFMGKIYEAGLVTWDSKGRSKTNSHGEITSPNLKYTGGINPTSDRYGDRGSLAGKNLLFGIDKSGSTYAVVDSNDKQNSAYTLRWPVIERFEVGQVAHFVSTIGAVPSGYALPEVKKTYTNSTPHSDGLNHIGDKLKFTLTVQNNGLNSLWDLQNIADAMPTGLTIDPDSVNYKWTGMTTSGTGNNQVDVEKEKASGKVPSASVAGNKIDYSPANILMAEKDKYYVTFDATINSQATGTLTNGVTFTGANTTPADSPKKYSASVDIPIKKTDFKYTFTNQLRNVSDDENSSFANTASGSQGDIIEYKSVFTSTSSDTMKTANYINSIPSSMELVSGSVTLNGAMQPDAINNLYIKGSTATVTYRAKITDPTPSTVSNFANMNNVVTNNGDSFNNLISDEAILNITEVRPTTAFKEVPSLIDFGAINSTGKDRILLNTGIKGNLLVNYPKNNNFHVSVSYDNDSSNALNNNGDKLVQDDGEVLFFNQKSTTDTDNWLPILNSPVNISNDSFSGPVEDYDLSELVGLGKWKLRVPGTAKAGKYSGKITWSIADAPL